MKYFPDCNNTEWGWGEFISLTDIHRHAQTRTDTHKHTQTHTDTHTQTKKHAHIQTNKYARTNKHAHACTNTHTHTVWLTTIFLSNFFILTKLNIYLLRKRSACVPMWNKHSICYSNLKEIKINSFWNNNVWWECQCIDVGIMGCRNNGLSE